MCSGHRINSDLLEIREVSEIKRYRLDIEGFWREHREGNGSWLQGVCRGSFLSSLLVSKYFSTSKILSKSNTIFSFIPLLLLPNYSDLSQTSFPLLLINAIFHLLYLTHQFVGSHHCVVMNGLLSLGFTLLFPFFSPIIHTISPSMYSCFLFRSYTISSLFHL